MLIKPINKKKVSTGREKKDRDESSLQIYLMSTSDKSIEKYLDRYQGINSEILNTTRVNENSEWSMTYLGISNMTRSDKITVEEKVLITE